MTGRRGHDTDLNTRLTTETPRRRAVEWRCLVNKRSSGLTVVEALVAIAIIGMLLALLLPAIQAARETGRRNTCKNHLRNMAEAIGHHESVYRRLPSNGWGFQWFGDPDRGTAQNQPGGWVYNILPYVDGRDLAVLGASQPETVKRRLAAEANQTVLGLFYCPTRRGVGLYPFDMAWPPRNADLVAETAKTDYAINAGDVFIPAGGPLSYQQAADPKFVWTDFSKATGVSYFRSMVTLANVRDGTSLTYLVGEKNLSSAGMDPGDDQGLLVGYDLDNSRWTLPGSRPRPDGSVSSPRDFGSSHPGVCQFIMCDGSARAISFEIDPWVHRRLGSRSDGGVIDAAAF